MSLSQLEEGLPSNCPFYHAGQSGEHLDPKFLCLAPSEKPLGSSGCEFWENSGKTVSHIFGGSMWESMWIYVDHLGR